MIVADIYNKFTVGRQANVLHLSMTPDATSIT